MVITIIADNGGGMTLQVINEDCGTKYQHYYDCSSPQLAEDVYAALNGDDATDWDNNDADSGWLTPMPEEIANGGYNVLEANCDHTVLEWGVDSGWNNVTEFTDYFAAIVHKED